MMFLYVGYNTVSKSKPDFYHVNMNHGISMKHIKKTLFICECSLQRVERNKRSDERTQIQPLTRLINFESPR